MADDAVRLVAYRRINRAGNLVYIPVGSMVSGSPVRPGDVVRVTLELCRDGEDGGGDGE